MSLVPNTITQTIRNFSRNKVICLKMDIGHSFYRVSVRSMNAELLRYEDLLSVSDCPFYKRINVGTYIKLLQQCSNSDITSNLESHADSEFGIKQQVQPRNFKRSCTGNKINPSKAVKDSRRT